MVKISKTTFFILFESVFLFISLRYVNERYMGRRDFWRVVTGKAKKLESLL